MMKTDDLQNAVDNIHKALINCTNDIISGIANRAGVSETTGEQWVEYANQLKRLVPGYAAPAWLGQACKEFGLQFNGRDGHHQKIAQFACTQAPLIYQPILVGEAASLNVEDLFSAQSQRFDLNSVFEGLISRLAELIAADVIDNRLVHESLTRLHALFRRNKSGSFAAVLLTMNYGRFFLNSFGGLLRANKYAKPIVENFEKEFIEASRIVHEAEEATKQEMISRLTNKVRMQLFLESNPELQPTIAGFLPPIENQDGEE
jgi:hypothetical protein